ncbi:MAG: hypothetical protein AAFR58_04655 [Cyanobacteria bacterium J06627_28]
MPYNSPHTVDIPAQAAESSPQAEPEIARPMGIREAIGQSIVVDVVLVAASLLLGVVLSGAVDAIAVSDTLNVSLIRPPLWFIFLSCVLPSVLWLLVDVLSALSNPAVLPFARSRVAMKGLYAKRMHLLLLAFYFTSILVALCWSAYSMLLISKIFVAAIFAIALFALGQSIPSRKMSFIVSGILFLVVLITTQAFIVMKLEADSVRVNQEALDEFSGSENGRSGGFPTRP